MTTPAAAPRSTVTQATAGVGTTPRWSTSDPAEHSPATRAPSSRSEEMRVSFPMATRGFVPFSSRSTWAAASPTL